MTDTILTKYVIPFEYIDEHMGNFLDTEACPIVKYFDSLGYNTTIGDGNLHFYPVDGVKHLGPALSALRPGASGGISEPYSDDYVSDYDVLMEALYNGTDAVFHFEMPVELFAEESQWRRKVI